MQEEIMIFLFQITDTNIRAMTVFATSAYWETHSQYYIRLTV
jgi:hypothetical protein